MLALIQSMQWLALPITGNRRTKMNKFKNILALTALSLLVLCLPSFASAQWGGNNRGNNRGGNNGGYYGGNIKNTINSLKYHAKNFERQTDRFDDRRDDRWGNRGGNNADRIEDLADDFAKATDRLEDKYGNGRNLNGSRDEAQRVLSIASRIDQALSRSRGSSQLRNSWNQMRGELNIIARTYGTYYNDNGRNNRNRNNRNFPFPF